MLKVEIKNNKDLVIFSENQIGNKTLKEFIGEITFDLIRTEEMYSIYQVSSAVARKGFGYMLYQCAVMYCATKNAYLCSDRDGDSKESAMHQWIKLNQNNLDIDTVELTDEECYNIDAFTNIDVSPEYYYAIQLKPTDYFLTHFSNVEFFSFKEEAAANDWHEFFTRAYEYENKEQNLFIDREFPLARPVSRTHEIAY